MVKTLQSESLDVAASVPKIAHAAVAVHKLLSYKFEDGLGSMAAVTEQLNYHGGVLKNFLDRLSSFFTGTFSSYVSSEWSGGKFM